MNRQTSITILTLGFSILFLSAHLRAQSRPDTDMVRKFEQFRKKKKFLEDASLFYPGLSKPALRQVLTNKINLSAVDFEQLAITGQANDRDYQDKIKIGLERFAENYLELDTEDRQRICTYFEELMDIVSLESSAGLLNKFMYDFDPAEK